MAELPPYHIYDSSTNMTLATPTNKANYTIRTNGSGTLTTSGSINLVDSGGFYNRMPKPDTLNATKLTKDNTRGVGAYILKTVGGEVGVDDKGVALATATFDIGDWIVEEYDFDANVIQFRRATIAERRKYDLR